MVVKMDTNQNHYQIKIDNIINEEDEHGDPYGESLLSLIRG